jgi:sugar phosphate isomerase/epimerase
VKEGHRVDSAIKRRIGIDLNRRMKLAPGLELAARHGIRYIDICLDPDPDLLDARHPRVAELRDRLASSGVTLGLHTLSSMNVAEDCPFLAEAADAYLAAYIKSARALGAGWVIVHGGYHFTADKRERMEVATARLARAAKVAESEGMTLLLENMNPEPEAAEVKYLVHDVDEAEFYFSRLTSPAVKWAFTSNHAHMLSCGVTGFLDRMRALGMDVDRIGEVRLADNRGTVEEHLYPGTGNMDFAGLFETLERRGYRGHYMQDYTSVEDMISGREIVAHLAENALAGANIESAR